MAIMMTLFNSLTMISYLIIAVLILSLVLDACRRCRLFIWRLSCGISFRFFGL